MLRGWTKALVAAYLQYARCNVSYFACINAQAVASGTAVGTTETQLSIAPSGQHACICMACGAIAVKHHANQGSTKVRLTDYECE